MQWSKMFKNVVFVIVVLIISMNVGIGASSSMPLPLRVVRTQILNSTNEPVRLRGVNCASLEWTSDGEGHIAESVRVAIDDWHVNHIRLPIIISEFGGAYFKPGEEPPRTRRGFGGMRRNDGDWLMRILQAIEDHKWSPGDDIIDILGHDNYGDFRSVKTKDQAKQALETVVALTQERNKIATFTETGVGQREANATWWTEILLETIKSSPSTRKLAWVLVWRNADKRQNYAAFPGAATVESFKAFEADPFTLFMEDLPKMYE